jgi:hypothetical protein
MSLAINVDNIYEVMLPDGKWYRVKNKSFDTDSYEFVLGKELSEGRHEVIFSGGQEKTISATGVVFESDDGIIYCPLTSIMAVKSRQLEG